MTTHTPKEALAFERQVAVSNTREWDGNCKRLARTAYNVPSNGTGTAAGSWKNTKHRGTGTPIYGALCWWTGGANGAGHVAIMGHDGLVWCNTWWNGGKVRGVELAVISERSSHLKYVGWSRDIDGVTVVPAVPAAVKAA